MTFSRAVNLIIGVLRNMALDLSKMNASIAALQEESAAQAAYDAKQMALLQDMQAQNKSLTEQLANVLSTGDTTAMQNQIDGMQAIIDKVVSDAQARISPAPAVDPNAVPAAQTDPNSPMGS